MSTVGKFQQPISGFTPLTFGGCCLWLDATSSSNFALSGSAVTTWYDLSPLSNHASNVNGGSPLLSNAVINTLPAVYFSNAPSIGGNLTLSNSGVTGFMVVRPLQTGIGRGDQRIFSAATSGTGDWNADSRFLIGPQGATTEIRFNRGNTYIPRANFNASNNYIISWTYDKASNYLYINGADADITQGVALSNSAFDTTLYRLGNQVAITSETYNGFIGEVVVYDDYLIPAQRRAVEGYLAWKWGIAPALGTTFSPLTSLSNCAIWFDGADATTFTLSGSNITQWRDKAGSNAASVDGTPVYTSNAVNGVPGVTLSAGSGFAVSPMSNPANTTTVSIYGVFTGGSGGNDYMRIVSAGNTADGLTSNDFSSSQLWSLMQPANPNYSIVMFHGGVQTTSASNVITSGKPVLVSSIYSGTTVTLWVNGSNSGSNSVTDTLQFNSLGIGKNITASNAVDTPRWSGTVGEVLIFYAAHTEAQRLQVESYLASKWNVSMRAPPHLVPTHTYTSRRPFARDFVPLDQPTCTLWLDAADAATLTLSSSNTVLGWADKSGNQRTVAMTSGNGTYSSNGFQSRYPTVSFTTGQFMTATLGAALTNSFSVFIVHQITGTGFNFAFAAGAANSIFYTVFRDDFNSYQIGQDSAGSTGNWYYTTQSNRPLVESIVVSPNTPYWNQYLNGVRLVNPNIGGSGTPPLSNVGSCNVMIPGADTFRGGPTQARYQGQICEVLVFTAGMTTSQRQTIENYLANKWGLRDSMQGSQAHPFRYGPALGVVPVGSPPGCTLWLDAADSTTITLSGSNVTQWNDKSGNGRHARPFGSGPTRGVNAVTFSGTQTMDGSATYLHNSNNGTWTVFSVFRPTSLAGDPRLLHYQGTPNRVAQFLYIDAGSLSTLSWLSGEASLVQAFGGSLASNTSYVVGAVNTTSNLTAYRNGVAGTPVSHGALTTISNGTYILGGLSATENRFAGDVYELLVFSNAFTDSQRQQVEGYLAAKWGLSSNLDASHPYKTGPQTSITPASIPGCTLWLDALDASSYTVSGSNLTAITDKSPNAWSLGTPTGFTVNSTKFNTTYPSFFSTGGASQLGSNGSFTLAQPLTVYFAGQATTANSSTFLFDGAGGTSTRVVIYQGATMFAGGEFSATNASASSNSHVISALYNGSNSSMRLNGVTTTGNPGSNGFGGIRISSRNTGSDGYPGHICELLIFSGAHTDAQRQQMEGYLAWKWGIPFRLPGGASNAASIYKTLTLQFDPRSLGACGAWFDAADSTTIQFSSGSNISRWLDKSGNQNHAATLAGTPTYTTNVLNGYPVVTFTGSQNIRSTYAPATSTTAQTMFVVARPSSISGTQAAITLGPSGSYTNPPPRTSIMFNSNWTTGWFLGADWGGYNGAGTGTDVSTTRTDIVVATWYSGSNGNTSANGTQGPDSTATTPALAVKSATGCLLIGANVDLGVNPTHIAFSGYIAEVLVYGKALTVADRQRIEGYLASKWGLQSQLPALHPYSNVKFF